MVRASTSMEMANLEGSPTPELLELYAQLARGGAGLVITDFAYVRREDQVSPADLGFYSDDQIPAFQALADVMRDHGAKSCLQIGFGGSMTGYTSTGLGTSGLPVRFNTRGEVTLFTLRRG